MNGTQVIKKKELRTVSIKKIYLPKIYKASVYAVFVCFFWGRSGG